MWNREDIAFIEITIMDIQRCEYMGKWQISYYSVRYTLLQDRELCMAAAALQSKT